LVVGLEQTTATIETLRSGGGSWSGGSGRTGQGAWAAGRDSAQALPTLPVRPAGAGCPGRRTTVLLEQFGLLGLAEFKLLKAVMQGLLELRDRPIETQR